MNSPELTVIGINLLITATAYLLLYPVVVGDSANKLVTYDLLLTTLSLLIVGSLFWGSGTRFSLLIAESNWFWFSLVTYAVVETPLMFRYIKQRNMSLWPDESD